jgi:peptidoglycan-associated lipoprotein
MKKILIACIIIAGLMAAGCSKKEVRTEPTMPPAKEQTAETTPSLKGPAVEKVTEAELARAETAQPSGEFSEQKITAGDIYFDFDMYDIREDSRPTLENTASILRKDSTLKLIVEGHCDERGTNEYNLALGDRRAKAAKDYLTAAGISSKRIQMISYGEEKPLCAEKTEDCWAKNRRAHFVFGK